MKRREFLKGAAATGLILPLRSDATASSRPLTEPIPIPQGTHAEALFPFKDSDIKFKMEDMMGLLRDGDHESWRLTAYPDANSPGVALIGAGFNLSVTADLSNTPGDPRDPYQYNAKARKEPSSRTLWEAAGLDGKKLDQVLEHFERHKKRFGRSRLAFATLDMLSHDITEEEATRLLYVSARQAVHNAMAYAKDFDQMTGPQQMGMSQLVYQMGSHLAPWTDGRGEEHRGFQNFLDVVNDTSYRQASAPGAAGDPKAARKAETEHWETVREHLIDSHWYRKYNTRAVEVVAMFDPDYDPRKPEIAEKQVRALAARMRKEHWQAGADKPQPGYVAREHAAAEPDAGKKR